jgi:hypothetical protein
MDTFAETRLIQAWKGVTCGEGLSWGSGKRERNEGGREEEDPKST